MTDKTKKKPIEAIAENYIVYVAGPEKHKKCLELSPYGLKTVFIDMMDESNNDFFEILNQMDGLAYGDKSLAMPKWVSVDCALLPSVIIGLAKPYGAVDQKIIESFEIPDGYKGFVPLTEFSAIPKLEKDTFVAHTLASIENGKHLGLMTKALGLKMLNAHNVYGIAQYSNPSLRIHSKIADMEIVDPKCSIHSSGSTFIYRSGVNQERLWNILHGKPEPAGEYDMLIDPSDPKDLGFLKDSAKKSSPCRIINPGQIVSDGKMYIPILLGT
jgi:hypothetical protein